MSPFKGQIMSDENDEQDPNLENGAEDDTEIVEDENGTGAAADADEGEDTEDKGSDGAEDDSDDDTDGVDELKEKLKKTNEQNKKLFARVQDGKGLKLDKATGKWVPKETNVQTKNKTAVKKDEISSEDLYTLIEAKVPKDDIREVTDYAKLKGITISEALKSNVVKTILSEKAEERATAAATSSGPTRRGSQKVSGKELLNKANKSGEIPEDEAGMDALVDARIDNMVKGAANN